MSKLFCILCINATEDADEEARELDHPANLIVLISAAISGFVGLPGNVYLILMITKNFSKRKQYEWLLFNLALINSVICLDNLFLQSQYISNFQNVGCQVAGFINYFFTILTFCTAPQITVNRYFALYNPTRFEKVFAKKNVTLMCTLPWLFAMVTCLPFLITDNLGLDETGLCDIQITTSDTAYLVLCGFHTPILLSYCISGYCTVQIVRKIRQHTLAVDSAVRVTSRVIGESRQLMRMVALLMIIPFISQIPGVVIKTMQIFIPVDPWLSRTAVAPFFAPSALNAYLTLFVIKSYRSSIKKIMTNFSWKKFLFLKSVTSDNNSRDQVEVIGPKRQKDTEKVNNTSKPRFKESPRNVFLI